MCQIVLYDTPGVIPVVAHKLDDLMMHSVRTATINADCLVLVIDATLPMQKARPYPTLLLFPSCPALSSLHENPLGMGLGDTARSLMCSLVCSLVLQCPFLLCLMPPVPDPGNHPCHVILILCAPVPTLTLFLNPAPFFCA